MVSRKADLTYLLIAIALSVIIAILVGMENQTIKQYAAIGIIGVALVFIIFFWPSMGAYVLIISVFSNISQHLSELGYPGTNKPLVVLVAAGILAHYFFYTRRFRSEGRTANIEFLLLAYFAIIVISYFPASYKYRTFERISSMAKDIAILYCIIFALRKPIDWKRAVWVIIITTAVLSCLGLYQVVTGDTDQNFLGLASVSMDEVIDGVTKPRLGGPIDAPNLWGQILVAVLALVIYRTVYEPKWWVKIASLVMMGLVFFEILNTYSRGAYIALGFMLLIVLLDLRLNPLFLLASLVIGLVFIEVSPTDYIARIETIGVLSPTSDYGIYQDVALRGRSSEVLAGMNMFFNHPVLGVGAGNYENNYQQYAKELGIEFRSEERQAHSLYVQILAETGILGMLAFGGMIFAIMNSLVKARKSITILDGGQEWVMLIKSIQLALMSYLITSLFLHGAYIRYFWIFIALAISSVRLTTRIVAHPAILTSDEAVN